MGMLILIATLLVIMPGLLYFTGWAIDRSTRKAPSWIGFPINPERRSDLSAAAPPQPKP